MHIPEGLYFIKWGLKKGNRIFGPKTNEVPRKWRTSTPNIIANVYHN
jgi:hypothetical protein